MKTNIPNKKIFIGLLVIVAIAVITGGGLIYKQQKTKALETKIENCQKKEANKGQECNYDSLFVGCNNFF